MWNMENFRSGRLSDYNYELVAAVSGEEVNGKLKEYFDKADAVKKVYVLDDGNSNYYQVEEGKDCSDLPSTYPDNVAALAKQKGALYNALDGLQLFSKEASEENVRKAYDDYYLAYGIYAEYGLPQCFSDEEIEAFQILEFLETLDVNQSYVLYNLCFRNISVFEVGENHRKVSLKMACQPQTGGIKKAWRFQYRFNMNFRQAMFGKLPVPVQERIQNLAAPLWEGTENGDVDDIFDISNLVMILNSRTATTTPVIEGLSEKASDFVTGVFVHHFFDKLERDEQTVFGRVITPKTGEEKYLFTPKKFTLTVDNPTFGTPSYDSAQTMLNYIVMCGDKNIPPLKKFSWRWLEASERGKLGGVMEINRDLLFARVCEQFKREILSRLRLEVNAWMEKQTVGFTYWLGIQSASGYDAAQFLLQPDGSYQYCYSHEKSSETVYGWIPPIFAASGSLAAKYSVACNARGGEITVDNVKYPALIFDARVVGWLDVVYDGGHSKGTIYDADLIFSLGIALDDYGNISFKKTFELKENKTTMDKSGWAEFASVGGIDSTVDGFTNYLKKWIGEFNGFAKSGFLNYFYTKMCWVMPGNSTFTYRDEGFTKGHDFYAMIKYVQE